MNAPTNAANPNESFSHLVSGNLACERRSSNEQTVNAMSIAKAYGIRLASGIFLSHRRDRQPRARQLGQHYMPLAIEHVVSAEGNDMPARQNMMRAALHQPAH